MQLISPTDSSYTRWDDCKTLTELPKLTHWCFDTSVQVGDVEVVLLDLLKYCASLRVLIFLMSTAGAHVEQTIMLDDPRYLVFWTEWI